MNIQDTSYDQGGRPIPVGAAGLAPTPATVPVTAAPLQSLPPLAPPPKPKSSGRAGTLLLGLAALVAVAGLAFAGGRLTAPASPAGRFGPGGTGGTFTDPGASGAPTNGFGGVGGSVDLRGTVVSVNASSMTIKTSSGQSITVELSGSTTYHQSTSATNTSVTPGATVSVSITGFGRGQGTGPAASSAPGVSANDVTVVTP